MSDSTMTKEAVVIERTFDASIDLIWQMWTQPEHFKIKFDRLREVKQDSGNDASDRIKVAKDAFSEALGEAVIQPALAEHAVSKLVIVEEPGYR